MKAGKVFIFTMIVLLLCCSSFAYAEQEGGKLSFLVTPGFTLPLGVPADTFGFGFGAEVAGFYSMPFAPWLVARGGIDYTYASIPGVASNLNTITFNGGAGVNFNPIPWLGVYANGLAGYYLSIYGDAVGGSVFLGGEGGVEFYLAPAFGLGVGASYRHLFSGTDAFYQGLKFHVGAKIRLGMGKRKANIEIFDIRFDPIFPVFYKHYDDHQVGSVGIRNSERGSIENVRVSFYAPQYMEGPKQSAVIPEMKKGAEETIPLYALFTDNVLSITEGTKINAQIIVEYDYSKNELAMDASETVRMYDRNAMTWDDDRKAAAFITAKDPEVLRFSKNVAGLVREHPSKAVNLNFRIAAGLFEGLKLHGVNYVIDPQTPYEDFSADATAIDYLQFPVQTLEYRAGDCDDLSICYSTLLESTGIETAFITIPGHIYMAFNLGVPPEEAKRMFLNPGDLIYEEESTWLPVEVTMVQDGFLKAWETGAKEWREHEPAGRAALYPIHDAWKEYEPVGLTGASSGLSFPGQDGVLEGFTAAVNRFVEREIADKVDDLERRIRGSQNPYRLQNKLGVLYARYGIMDKAKVQFEAAAKRDYAPALINMGNILFLEEKYDEALTYYERADDLRPGTTSALVGIAKVNYELENHGSVKRAYEQIQRKDPDLAARFGYLVSGEGEATGRASAAMIRETVVWDEEE